jgi:Methyltransferase domain
MGVASIGAMNLRAKATTTVRRVLRYGDTLIERVRPPESDRAKLAGASDYWSSESDDGWNANSHWRGGLGEQHWSQVGADHLAMYTTFAAALRPTADLGSVIEWGCGGGANAVAFAPGATWYVAADVSKSSVAECIAQVASVCSTPVEGLVIDIASPEEAAAGYAGHFDVFLCTYVLELTASPTEALRIAAIAHQLLAPGGLAMIQVKYHTAARGTRGRRRNYRKNLANMTTFGIDEFWCAAQDIGLTPRLVTLIPENHLDARYAYYALEKP